MTSESSYPPEAGPEWTILVPIKSTGRGKSRLDVTDEHRPALALAMAIDTVSAAAQCGRVLAVVEDESDAAALRGIERVQIHLTAVTGLNESIRDGLALLASSVSHATAAVAVLPGDLPGICAQELAAVLRSCADHLFSVVPDHLGVGTTLLAATRIEALQPSYGPDSFRRHQRAGAVPIDLPADSTLRWDVDTIEDLLVASGPRTSAARRGIAAGRDRSEGAGVTVDACTEDS